MVEQNNEGVEKQGNGGEAEANRNIESVEIPTVTLGIQNLMVGTGSKENMGGLTTMQHVQASVLPQPELGNITINLKETEENIPTAGEEQHDSEGTLPIEIVGAEEIHSPSRGDALGKGDVNDGEQGNTGEGGETKKASWKRRARANTQGAHGKDELIMGKRKQEGLSLVLEPMEIDGVIKKYKGGFEGVSTNNGGDWREPVPPLITNLLAWNCRGLGNPCAVRALVELIKTKDPKLVFLSETKLFTRELDRISKKCKMKHFLGVDAEGRSGGIAMFWKEEWGGGGIY